MKQTLLTINTIGRSIMHITEQIARVITDNPIQTGLCHLFLQHPSASLIICENADPQVLQNIEAFMQMSKEVAKLSLTVTRYILPPGLFKDSLLS